MNILKFNEELSDQEKFLSTKIPGCNMKFRNQFCVTGSKFEYTDLSKVKVNTDKMSIVPKIFSKDDEAIELDYIGLYSIGILELLYLGLCSAKEDDCHSSVAQFSSMFTSSVNNVFSSCEDVENIYDVMSSLAEEGNKYNEAFNLYFMMRTHYDRSGHQTLLRYADWLMLIWLVDPQTYWEVFFDILSFTHLSLLTMFSDYLNPNIDFDVKQPWLSKDNDLKFGAIEYSIPGTDKIRKITDCRGISIYLVWSLYYRLLYNYGFDCERTPAISYHDDRIIKEIDKVIKSCIGDDNQSKALKGKGLSQKAEFNTLNMFVYDQPNNVVFTINSQKFVRHYYEEVVLFMNRHNIDQIQYNKNINMHYSNIYNLFAAIGELFYLSSAKLMVNREQEYVNAILTLKDSNDKLIAEVERQHNLYKDAERQCRNIENEEIESLKKQLAEAQSIIENKTKTIGDLVKKNSELNKRIDDFYADEDNLEEENEEISITTIEEMVALLNDFKILMVGGRTELLSKLNEYGWVNVDQVDKNNISTGVDVAKYSDFCVINTRFISHTLAHKVESVTESERRMSFNGTNPEKLIVATYDFVKKYFEKE